MRDDQEPAAGGRSDGHEPPLRHRVAIVRKCRRKRIFQHCRCLMKSYAVLSEVRGSLRRIPLKLHLDSIRVRRIGVRRLIVIGWLTRTITAAAERSEVSVGFIVMSASAIWIDEGEDLADRLLQNISGQIPNPPRLSHAPVE